MPKMFQGRAYSDLELIDLGERVEAMVRSPEFLYLKELAKDFLITDLFNPKVEEHDVSRLYGQSVAFQLFFDTALRKVRREATSAAHNLRRLKEDGEN